jgi:hypothetical protein
MTIYKSAADEIAEIMYKKFNKEAYRIVSFETFKNAVNSAKMCKDLKRPQAWFDNGRLIENRGRAFKILMDRKKELCKQ